MDFRTAAGGRWVVARRADPARAAPLLPALRATEGALSLLEARAAKDPAARQAAARRAREALGRAVSLNPLLRREAGEALEQAERLAGGAP